MVNIACSDVIHAFKCFGIGLYDVKLFCVSDLRVCLTSINDRVCVIVYSQQACNKSPIYSDVNLSDSGQFDVNHPSA